MIQVVNLLLQVSTSCTNNQTFQGNVAIAINSCEMCKHRNTSMTSTILEVPELLSQSSTPQMSFQCELNR